MKRFLWLGAVLCLLIICLSCGEVFRPIIIPNPPKFPNPAAAHSVLILSDNGTINAGVETPQIGSAMVIDVSGDTDESQKNLGLVPIHGVQQTANQVIVANQSAPGTMQDSLTKLTFSGTAISSASTISLPAGSAPNFVATAETGRVYVSTPGNTPPSFLPPYVLVVDTARNTVTYTVQVGLNPVAIAETADTQKFYVANNGDNTVDGFNTQGPSQRTLTGTFNAPLWIAARGDSQRVYVLNGNGAISTIDTSTTGGPDTVIDASINVPGASYLWYDVILNRLYVPYSGGLKVADVSQSTPSTLADIPITAVSPTSRSATDPCFATTTGTLHVIAATSLPDGTRAYVGSYYIDSADNVCPQVTVINATNFTVKTVIPIPGFPNAANPANPTYYVPTCATTRDQVGPMGNGFRIMMAAGGDSTRTYLSTCDGGNVNIIQTATDTYYFNLPAPYSARPPLTGASENPPQNPVFMIAGP
jgi:DNA-binding beta-propeller fold protein YncE